MGSRYGVFGWFFLSTFVLASVSLVFAGCDRSAGAPKDGGAPDADAMTALQLPGCLRDLYARCLPATAQCHTSTDDRGKPVEGCLSSGERFEFSESSWPTAEPACNTLYTRKLFKSDGTLCYSYEYYRDAKYCESLHETWRDATGQAVATSSSGINERSITCEASGETLSCKGNTCPDVRGIVCVAGSCPFN